MKLNRKSRIIFLLIALWAIAVGGGLRMMLAYDNSPGGNALAPAFWPSESAVAREPGAPTLVMVIHPQCPCSRASVGELAELMAEVPSALNARVLFIRPEQFSEGWEQTSLWDSAVRIPGVKVDVDINGAEALRFGAQTSGQVVLYDKEGKLLFNGGITASRGHAGDNDGRRAIVSILRQGSSDASITPVYGCPLFKPSQELCHAPTK